MERILLYTHFNKLHQVSGHVFYQLKQIKPLFSTVVFISNSPLEKDDKTKLQKELNIDIVIERDNIGFDFAAWRDGMQFIGFDKIQGYDSLTIMNDTCFGPLWDLQKIYEDMEANQVVDFWGMTNFRKTKYFKEHLQSYFVSFKQSMLGTEVFQRFWSQIKEFTDVQSVIDQYETQFTMYFQKEGFHYQTFYDTRREEAGELVHPDFSYYKPQTILEKKVPFLKVKAIDGNPFLVAYLLEKIKATSSYPVSLIIEHMREYFFPDAPYLLKGKLLRESKEATSIPKDVVLHIHVTNLAIFEQFIPKFVNLFPQFEYLLTTPDQKIAKQLSCYVNGISGKSQIVLTQEQHPLLAMFAQAEQLKAYQYIGHLSTHTLVTETVDLDEWMRSELLDMMIENSSNSLHALKHCSGLGLILPDLPSIVRNGLFYQEPLKEEMGKIWKTLSCRKSFTFTDTATLTRVYGGFMWFKYEALEPFFKMRLENLSCYSLQEKSTILENLLVYVVWDKNYDFQIMPLSQSYPSLLDLQYLNNQLVKQQETLKDRKSIVKRLARFIGKEV